MNATKCSAERVSRTSTLWPRAWPITYRRPTMRPIPHSSPHCRNTNLILSVDIRPSVGIASLELTVNCGKPTTSRKQTTSGDKQSKRVRERPNPCWTERGEMLCCLLQRSSGGPTRLLIWFGICWGFCHLHTRKRGSDQTRLSRCWLARRMLSGRERSSRIATPQ